MLRPVELMFFLEAWIRLQAMSNKLRKSNAQELSNLLQQKNTGDSVAKLDIDLNRAWLMVNRAARIQGRNTMCLPRSLVLVDMLSARGQDAMLKIGVNQNRDRDSKGINAHAWVEVNGEIVGEKASVENRFLELI